MAFCRRTESDSAAGADSGRVMAARLARTSRARGREVKQCMGVSFRGCWKWGRPYGGNVTVLSPFGRVGFLFSAAGLGAHEGKQSKGEKGRKRRKGRKGHGGK